MKEYHIRYIQKRYDYVIDTWIVAINKKKAIAKLKSMINVYRIISITEER